MAIHAERRASLLPSRGKASNYQGTISRQTSKATLTENGTFRIPTLLQFWSTTRIISVRKSLRHCLGEDIRRCGSQFTTFLKQSTFSSGVSIRRRWSSTQSAGRVYCHPEAGRAKCHPEAGRVYCHPKAGRVYCHPEARHSWLCLTIRDSKKRNTANSE